jgi:hypothetical protein
MRWLIPCWNACWKTLIDAQKPFHSKLHHEDHSTETAEDAFPNNAGIMLEQGKVCITEDMAALTEFELKCNAECPQDKYPSRIKSSENARDPGLSQANDKGDRLIKASSETMASEKLDTSNGSVSIPGDAVQPNASPDAALMHPILWEGTIQLNQTSFTKVFAIFKRYVSPLSFTLNECSNSLKLPV